MPEPRATSNLRSTAPLTGRSMNLIVTGASSGLGRALALHYARHEHTVGAAARRADLLESLARECPERIVPLPVDICDASSLEQAMHRFAIEQGGLDLVYVNAGVGQSSPEEGWDPDRARRIAEVNIVGSTNTITTAATIMLEQGRGRIVGISSLAGAVSLPSSAAYGASKAWMAFYLQSLDLDLREAGVRCAVVMPGHIPTPMVDGGPAARVSRGAERAAAHIAERVARGDSMIRFPRRIALLTRLGAMMPAGLRRTLQRRRLTKRSSRRNAPGGEAR